MKKDRWAARIEDFEPGDQVEIWCERCGHEAIVEAAVFVEAAQTDPKTAKWGGLMNYTRVLDLKYHVKCRNCPAPLNGKPHREYYIRIRPAKK